jgi:hypothetical protein
MLFVHQRQQQPVIHKGIPQELAAFSAELVAGFCQAAASAATQVRPAVFLNMVVAHDSS